MSKPNAILGVLASSVLCCLPVAAATISNEIHLALGGSAQQVGPNHFHVAAGSVATIKMESGPGDQVWLFAVADDQWGEANYTDILTLFYGSPADGQMSADLWVPPALVNMTFHIQAVAMDSKGELYGSEMLTITVPGAQILQAPEGRRVVSRD